MAGSTEWISAYSPFIGSASIQDEGFTHGTNLTDVIGNVASLREEFELCLSQNPEQTFVIHLNQMEQLFHEIMFKYTRRTAKHVFHYNI